MNKKIAVLGAGPSSLSFYKQAKELGYEIHCFAWEEGAVCKDYSDFFYPISFLEKETILEICKTEKIQGVTSFSLESALPAVNYIARGLNLPCNTIESERLTVNKYTMRERLQECGISIPRFCIVDSEITNIDIDFPLIVKPIDSGGSRGVTKVLNENELNQAIVRALGYSKLNKAIVEEYIDGREFSVEYISHRGEHHFVAITDKVTTGEPYFVELEHHQPANISKDVAQKIKKITVGTLNALKIFSSTSHTEIKMSDSGILFIIELGSRVGGDFITSDLVRLSTGYDFVKGVLELATNNFSKPIFNIQKYSGVFFLSKETEGLKKYINKDIINTEIIDTELYKDDICEVHESGDRSGHFIYQSEESKFLI